MNKFKSTLLATALLAVAPLASAATDDDTMTVSITILNSCAITADDMNFNTHADVATARQASSEVHVTCSGAGPIQVGLNAGNGGASTFATRQMDDNLGNTIDFNLRTAAGGLGTVIGDGTAGTTLLFNGTSIAGAAGNHFTVHGYVPAQGPKPSGVYSSDIVATVTY